MFRKSRYLVIITVFCTFLLLNIYVANSLVQSDSAQPAAVKESAAAFDASIYEEINKSHKFIPPQTAASNQQEQIKYIIKSGDTLWDISSAYKIDVNNLIAANNLESPDSLKIGQEIIIPGASELKEINNKKSSGDVKLASRSGSAVPAISGSWPVSGRLSSRFGKRGGAFHKGIDIAASTGTEVHAFADGKVIFSGWDNGGYGYLVIISHSNGYETYYAHNSKLKVKAGQTVSKGQLIANVGNTGDSNGSHCHFEIRRNGTPVNPLSFLN